MYRFATSGDRMVVGAFPVFKLGALVLKQVSKPLANVVKARAKSSPFFRTYICMPPAQFYHWCEVKMKMWSMNLGKPVSIPKLNENMAIELGAELLGEGVIFVTAAGILVFEYVRTSRKETAKEESRKEELAQIQSELKDLYFAKAKQDAQIRELIRVLHVNIPSASILQTEFNPNDIPEHHRYGATPEAETSIFGTMKGLIWSAVDIILPPVNEVNESSKDSQKSTTVVDTPKVRTILVTDSSSSSSSQDQKTSLEVLNKNSSPSSSSSSNNSNSPNSKSSGSGSDPKTTPFTPSPTEKPR